MFRYQFIMLLCLFFFVIPGLAQDVPDELDDYAGDWDGVIGQIADSGYLNANNGEFVLDENRVRFRDSDNFFIRFDTDDLTDFVMAGTLQLSDYSEDDFAFCTFTFRDSLEDGFLAAGITNSGMVTLYDSIFDSDDNPLVDFQQHGRAVDDEIHLLVMALDDEVTVYVDGVLVFEEDDLSVRDAALGLLRTEGIGCDLDDLWVWQIEDRGRSMPGTKDGEGDTPATGEPELPEQIENFAEASEPVMAQFEQAGIVATGSSLLFGEDFAFIGASGSAFTPLGSGRNRTDIVMGGALTFVSESSEYEVCGLLLRLDDARDPAEDFLFTGLDSDGNIFIQNNSRNSPNTFDFITLDLELRDTHHLIIVARGDRLALYINGDLVIEDYPVYEVRGIFGVGQISDSLDSSCEARNIWVYDTPAFEPGVCNAIANGTINQRSGPSTDTELAGQLANGDSLQIDSQTDPGDGFIWYALEDGSYVREDIVSLAGDCANIEAN